MLKLRNNKTKNYISSHKGETDGAKEVKIS